MKIKFIIKNFKKLVSTNIYAKRRINLLNSGDVIVAKEQISGKGRFERKWHSPPGGLYFSMILKKIDLRYLNSINYIFLLSVIETLKNENNINSAFKWPNDLMLNSKKFGGLLAETFNINENAFDIILGCGINLNIDKFPKDLQNISTSVFLEKKIKLNTSDFLKKLLKLFNNNFDTYGKNNLSYLLKKVTFHCETIGKMVKIQYNKEIFEGKAVSLNKNFTLSIKFESGDIKDFFSCDKLIQ